MAHFAGMPIYADQVRQLMDSATELQPHNWHPANVAAEKLFRCVESLRDIDELLKSAGRSKSVTKRRRKLKIMLTPLHSLAESIRNLLDDLECNPDSVCRLPPGARELLPHMRSELLRNVAIGRGGLLSTTRNKISAHIDKDLSSEEMRELLAQAEPAQVGFWLHACVSVFSDLIKLPVFFWSCDAEHKDAVRILFSEPFVVTLGIDPNGKVNSLLNIHLITQPPRYDIFRLLMKVVSNSKWMFGPSDQRITRFVEDGPGTPWAKSLDWLPKLGPDQCDVKLPPRPSVIPKMFGDDGWTLLIPTNVPFFVKPQIRQTT